MKVAILARSFSKASPEPIRYLEQHGFEVLIRRNHEVYNEAKVAELIGDADAAIVGSDRIGRIVFERCLRLKAISKHGVGLDNIDLEEAKKRNIEVTITPGANHESVADLTWGLILCAARNIVEVSSSMKRDATFKNPYLSCEVYGKTLGVIGYGRIGMAVAKRAIGFDQTVLVYDPYLKTVEPVLGKPIHLVSLEELLEQSDILSLHAPLTEETEKILDRDAFGRMKEGVILVNTSRGALIDEEALYDALVSGKVRCAALDVFAHEPPVGNKLLQLDNVIPTPHMGTHTREANNRMGMMAAENVVRMLKVHHL